MLRLQSSWACCLLVVAAQQQIEGYYSFNTSYNSDPVYGPASPPHYPSPYGTGWSPQGDWESAYAAATEFVKKLTLVEKVNITTGTGWTRGPCVGNTGSVPSQGFNGLCLQDGPLGVRGTDYNTVFPALSQAGMTWNRDLIRRHGLAMGEEFRAKGVNVQLGPVCGPLGTFPEGGRNWEGFSPDPYLCGQAMFESVIGIQSSGTIACAKHFVGNEQEHFRDTSDPLNEHLDILEAMSSNIDDRVMHELYLWPFSDAVRAGVGSIMCSYNQLNNSYACQNSALLNGLLKDELDFQGFVMSDWGAAHSGVATYLAGLDMLMPGDGVAFGDGLSWFGRNLTISVLNGTVPQSLLDDKVIRIMAAYYKMQQNTSYPPPNFNHFIPNQAEGYLYGDKYYTVLNEFVDVREQHALVAQEVNRESIVLLKNSNNALPLNGSERWLNIIGQDSRENPRGANDPPSQNSFDQGTLGIGWGSGTSNYPYLITPLEAISARARSLGSLVYSFTDNYAYAQINATAKVPMATSIVFIHANSGEGYIFVDSNVGDRNNLTAWASGDKLVETVATHCPNTIVVVHAVGPIIMESWIDNPNVTAVVWAGLPGQESGNTLAAMLYGDHSPSGKLPYTIAKSASDYPSRLLYDANAPIPQYNFTSLNIDYRHFDTADITPRFEFGFGLSYSSFQITPGSITRISDAPYAPRSAYPTRPGAALKIPQTPSSPQEAFAPENMELYDRVNYPYIQNTTDVEPGDEYPYPYSFSSVSSVNSSTSNGERAIVPTRERSPAGGGPGGNPSLYDTLLSATANVSNTGAVEASEVVQLYVSFPSSADFPSPKHQLRGFSKVSVLPGGTAEVSFDVTRRDMSVWDTTRQNWRVLQGEYVFFVGNSSRALQRLGTVEMA